MRNLREGVATHQERASRRQASRPGQFFGLAYVTKEQRTRVAVCQIRGDATSILFIFFEGWGAKSYLHGPARGPA